MGWKTWTENIGRASDDALGCDASEEYRSRGIHEKLKN